MSTFASKSKLIIGESWSYVFKTTKVVFNIFITDSFRGFAHLSPQTETNYKEYEGMKEMVTKFNDEYLEKGWGLLLTCIRCLLFTFVSLSTIFKNNSDYSKVIFYQWPVVFIVVTILDKLFQDLKNYRGVILSIIVYFMGWIIIYRTICRTTYSMYENWMIYIQII